jgi:hypothetical protein
VIEEQSCRGKLTQVKEPKKIEFNFTTDSKPQYTTVVATDFFENLDSAKCPITKCAIMG